MQPKSQAKDQLLTPVGSLLTSARRYTTGVKRFGRAKPLGATGAVIVLVMGALALLAPVIAPYDSLETHYDDLLVGPQFKYLLGTDDFGRDLLSRLIWGTRQALYIGVVSVAIGMTAGGVLGLVSAFRGGWLDILMQRLMDAFLSFPVLILALAIVAMLGARDINVIVAIAVVNVPIANRVLRSVTLSAKEEMYVDAARAIGCSDWRMVFRHILPNIMAPYIIVVTGQLAWAIVVASSLSFLGVASPPPEPSWGRMIAEGVQEYAERAPWLAILPGVFLGVTVFGFNILGDALRDVLDPRLRGR